MTISLSEVLFQLTTNPMLLITVVLTLGVGIDLYHSILFYVTTWLTKINNLKLQKINNIKTYCKVNKRLLK